MRRVPPWMMCRVRRWGARPRRSLQVSALPWAPTRLRARVKPPSIAWFASELDCRRSRFTEEPWRAQGSGLRAQGQWPGATRIFLSLKPYALSLAFTMISAGDILALTIDKPAAGG